MCSSPALWAPAARGTCPSSVFRVVGSGRGTEKLERPSLNLTWRRTGQRGPGRGPDCHRVKLILVDACRRSIICGMCLIVEKPESDSPWKQPGLMFFHVPGPPLQTGRPSHCSAADCAKHTECFAARASVRPPGDPPGSTGKAGKNHAFSRVLEASGAKTRPKPAPRVYATVSQRGSFFAALSSFFEPPPFLQRFSRFLLAKGTYFTMFWGRKRS